MPKTVNNDKPTHASLPVGKLPQELLKRILSRVPISDPRVIFGPGLGRDCAVVDAGQNLLVFKSDPITFATDQIGWYAVQVCANDIVTMGALPRWFLATLLLPEGKSPPALVEEITSQLFSACRELDISILGGHTEITYGIDRPILAGTMIGEVDRDELVTPEGIRVGDRILLTKGVPIEATAILAREYPQRIVGAIGQDGLEEAANYLYQPGISVFRDARAAVQAGKVTGMHDPTEGGIVTALWEMAQASHKRFLVNLESVPVPALSQKIFESLQLNPLAAISSGALLITASEEDADRIIKALSRENISCTDIGRVEEGQPEVWDTSGNMRKQVLPADRDELCKILED